MTRMPWPEVTSLLPLSSCCAALTLCHLSALAHVLGRGLMQPVAVQRIEVDPPPPAKRQTQTCTTNHLERHQIPVPPPLTELVHQSPRPSPTVTRRGLAMHAYSRHQELSLILVRTIGSHLWWERFRGCKLRCAGGLLSAQTVRQCGFGERRHGNV